MYLNDLKEWWADMTDEKGEYLCRYHSVKGISVCSTNKAYEQKKCAYYMKASRSEHCAYCSLKDRVLNGWHLCSQHLANQYALKWGKYHVKNDIKGE
jgi:hypothetical protein